MTPGTFDGNQNQTLRTLDISAVFWRSGHFSTSAEVS